MTLWHMDKCEKNSYWGCDKVSE